MTAIPAQRCTCGYLLEAASPAPGHTARDAAPKPGDLTVCFECAAPLRFDEALRVVPVDLATLSLEARSDVERAQAQIRAFRKLYPHVKS